VGPEHAWLKDSGRAEYVWASDQDALEGFQHLGRTEGILPALESAHAIAYLKPLSARVEKGSIVLVNLSGRGDKDVQSVEKILASRLEAKGE
jgi:tryptophan synthase beta chain